MKINSYIKSKQTRRNEPKKAAKISKRAAKRVKEETLNELYFRCKEISEQGEVNYFSLEDIWSITEELKRNK